MRRVPVVLLTRRRGPVFRLRHALVIAWMFVAALSATAPQTVAPLAPRSATIPARLSDTEFWKLSTDLSEPGGYFRSDNLVSNEHTFQYVLPALTARVPAGAVYLGVAPDQNFTYIVASQPSIAFILDVRRGNLLQHLLYKALIELSADRAEFLSRLFAKKRPPGVSNISSVVELFEAYEQVPTTQDLYAQNVRAVRAHLTARHGFPLSADDLEQIEAIHFAFFWDGPGLRYSANGGGRSSFPTYQELMLQTDWEGKPRGYLATEANFRRLKNFEERNLLVPVVGNFAGPKAMRAIGKWVRERGAAIGAFYVSNVEQYLFQDALFPEFARNVATLPVNEASAFIRSVSARFGYRGTMLGPDGRASALDPIRAFVRDFEAGRIQTYADVNSRSR